MRDWVYDKPETKINFSKASEVQQVTICGALDDRKRVAEMNLLEEMQKIRELFERNNEKRFSLPGVSLEYVPV